MLKHLTLLSVLLGAGTNGAAAQTELAKDADERIAQAVKATGVAPKPFDFYTYTPYRENVPRPDVVLGYSLGTWHTTFYAQEKALTAIAQAAEGRVKMWQYGASVEGRPLRLFAVASPANLARLEAIRAANVAVANGGSPPPDLPAIVWINHCIHGSETASFETAMATLYTLAASDAPAIRAALDNAVILLNPVFNPDGHERFVVAYNAAATGDARSGAFENETPWLMQGRYNHNRFDMNRDKIAQSQPETQAETAEYLRWMPHVFVDQHGQPETYFFPPNAQATNPHVDRDRMNRWTQIFGRANGAAFDARGWAYVNRETYDLFYPGYLDSFTSLNGAVGMTYETDGGGELVTKKRDGSFSTLRDAAARHFETAIATVTAAAKNRAALLSDFATFRADAAKFAGGVIISPERDPVRAAELASLLVRVGVHVSQITAPVTVDTVLYDTPRDKRTAHTFPAGSLFVPYGQPQGHLARALLERDTATEPDFAARQRREQKANALKNPNEPTEDFEFYDTTAWSLPLLWNLSAGAVETLPKNLATVPVAGEVTAAKPAPLSVAVSASTAREVPAYAIPFASDNALTLAARLTQSGNRVSVAEKPVAVANVTYPAGTFFLRTGRNPADASAKLSELAATLGVKVVPLASTFGGAGATDTGLGSDVVRPVPAPRVAVLAGDGVSQTGFGGVAFTLKQMGITFSPVSVRALQNAATRDRFNVIILPEGGYGSRLTKDERADLKAWTGRGNTLIALGSGTTWLLDKETEIATVRAVGDDEDNEKTKAETPTPLPGALFRARIRTDHFLGWGYPEGFVAVPVAGNIFWQPSTTGANVATFAKNGDSRLSGFTWDDTGKLLAGTAYVVDEPVGSGHAILFLNDPCERYLYAGLRRMFASAVLLGARNTD